MAFPRGSAGTRWDLQSRTGWRTGSAGSPRRRSRSAATFVPSMCCRRSEHESCGISLRRRSISGLPCCPSPTAPRTVQEIRACLNRAVKRAMARDQVKRNVVELTDVPTGQPGRRSKSLTPEQVDDVLNKTAPDRLHPYVVLSLLTGARTEELRAMHWQHVHLDGQPDAVPPIPPHLEVWRSVREGGDTKTRKSRRTLAIPARCVEALRKQRAQQLADRLAAGERWQESGLVFTTALGSAMDAANVRRDLRRALTLVPGLDPAEWTPRELRHSFVSVLSDSGLPVEEISRLVGHSGTSVTELVYRHQLRPVIQTGATVMDRLFGRRSEGA